MKGSAQESKNNMKKKKRSNKFLKGLLILLIIIMIAVGGGYYYYIDQTTPVAEGNIKEMTVEIPRGSTTQSIAQLLENKNLIKNRYLFRAIAKLEKQDGKLKAGKYVLDTGMTPREILSHLVQGGILKETVTFTVPEGYEIKLIVDKLSNQGLIDGDVFLDLVKDPSKFVENFEFLKALPENATLEGYLFPDTYEIYTSATEEDIIYKMLDRFDDVYQEILKDDIKDHGLTLNEIITLASIIEREGMVNEERPVISAVFYNRLEKDMLLQSCATVQFILGERKENLTYDDLEIQSDYNTYIHGGLPPGPIASPGRKSIEAALNPADVDYLFFVSNGDGSHTFTTNLKDHLDAKNKIN